MCIINAPAEVSKTQILVSPNLEQTRQLVVYSNQVESQYANNAMILPIPHPDTLQLHDLSQYADIFTDCQACFETSGGDFGIRSRSVSRGMLAVIDCGSYQVSVVPSERDFARLDPKVFQLQASTARVLSRHYPQSFGFLVCKLRQGRNAYTYHPIAYSHQIYQYGVMFVPTRHHHPIAYAHQIYQFGATFVPTPHHEHQEETQSDYDHTIYSLNTKDLSGNGRWNYQWRVQTQKIPQFQFPEPITFRQLTLKGRDKNTDMYLLLETHAVDWGHHYGLDGCIFKTNNPAVTFKNVGSIYILPMYQGLPFYNDDSDSRHPLRFAGSETTFMVNINGNEIHVVDDIDTPEQYEMMFRFDPTNQSRPSAVYRVE